MKGDLVWGWVQEWAILAQNCPIPENVHNLVNHAFYLGVSCIQIFAWGGGGSLPKGPPGEFGEEILPKAAQLQYL